MRKVDLSPLIRALESLNKMATYQQQIDLLELLFIEAELNPNPLAFSDLADGLDLLAQFQKREALPWGEAQEGLEAFFVGKPGKYSQKP